MVICRKLNGNHLILHRRLGGGPRVVVSTAAFKSGVRGPFPGLGGLKETYMFLPHPLVKLSIVGSLRDREVACSASERQDSNSESCVRRAVSSHSSHHPQEVLLARFSLYVHKSAPKPDSFIFILHRRLISGWSLQKNSAYSIRIKLQFQSLELWMVAAKNLDL